MSYEKNEVQKMQGLRLIATKNGIKFNEGSEVAIILAGWDVDPYHYIYDHSDHLDEIFDVPIFDVRYLGYRGGYTDAKLAMYSHKMGVVIWLERRNFYSFSSYAQNKEIGKRKRLSACF